MPLDLFFSYANLAGPTVDSTMTLSILSSRDAGPNIAIALSFNVSYGPPSRVNCDRKDTPDAITSCYSDSKYDDGITEVQ